jgi:hypothetical protein
MRQTLRESDETKFDYNFKIHFLRQVVTYYLKKIEFKNSSEGTEWEAMANVKKEYKEVIRNLPKGQVT